MVTVAKRITCLKSILNLRNKGSEYRLLLPGFSPSRLVSLIWKAIEKEGQPLVNDMGILSMWIIHLAVSIEGSRLLGALEKDQLNAKIDSIYGLSRPERSLRFSMQNVHVEDKKPVVTTVYDASFSDFKKYLPTILENAGRKDQ